MSPPAEVATHHLNVLIVEDSRAQGQAISDTLCAAGCEVRLVGTRRELNTAPELLEFDVQVVFVDVHLGDGNGIDLIQPLQRRWPGAVVVMMTTNGADSFRALAEAREAGADLVLPKPFGEEEARRILAEARGIRASGHRSVRVVVIDDCKTVCSAIVGQLASKGIQASAFQDAEQAIERIHYDHVDVVITDLVMPETPGEEVIRLVREVWPHVGVVAMSAGEGADKQSGLDRARKCGADAVLSKPFRIWDLMDAMERARSRSTSDDYLMCI